MKTITIKQETKIPGTDYVLEAGDRISIKDKVNESIEGSLLVSIERVLLGRGKGDSDYTDYFTDSDTGKQYEIQYDPKDLRISVEVPGPPGESVSFFITELIYEPISEIFQRRG